MLNASAISTNYFPKLIENYINIDRYSQTFYGTYTII